MKEWKNLKTSEKEAVYALICGIVAGLGAFWFLPGAHWAVPVVFGIVMTVGVYQASLKTAAARKQADQGDE
ncbi:hypothetical protein [Alloalcanivorax xenomutans]|uniref:hypothetical protein n=1 Tax=Alloalcanivorax xenomutans TaxID=1094342 RepID=UPI003C6A17DC